MKLNLTIKGLNYKNDHTKDNASIDEINIETNITVDEIISIISSPQFIARNPNIKTGDIIKTESSNFTLKPIKFDEDPVNQILLYMSKLIPEHIEQISADENFNNIILNNISLDNTIIKPYNCILLSYAFNVVSAKIIVNYTEFSQELKFIPFIDIFKDLVNPKLPIITIEGIERFINQCIIASQDYITMKSNCAK